MESRENLGPAETIIQALLAYSDHMTHNRPGVCIPDSRSSIGVRWEPVTHKEEEGVKKVFRLIKVGNKNRRVPLGTLQDDGSVVSPTGNVVGQYQPSGIFPQVAAWYYKQIAEVWKLDNEFAARWASFAFKQEHRDLKVVLAAFLLVQSRKGEPVVDAGEVIFHDDDYRSVGEAMLLLQEKGKDFNPKLLLRVCDVLQLPEVAAINRELGFGNSSRKPFLGRWNKTVDKWLRFREDNPRMLDGLVKAGFRTTVMELARRIGYKPNSNKFFDALRWKQKQASDGRRTISIGKAVAAAETWQGLSEEEICERIESSKPNWKRIVGMLPSNVGVTRAVMAAAVDSGSLSKKDLIILTPTLEELGLLSVKAIKDKWAAAVKAAEDARAANIARNVSSKEIKETLEDGADKAVQNAVAEQVRGLRIYFMVDISGSMQGALEAAKPLVAKFLQSIPVENVHVSVFNTTGREVTIKHPSTKGVEAAFKSFRAGGGTDYGAGIRALQKYTPKADEDALFIFIGDEEAVPFKLAVDASGLNPVAFGFMKTIAHGGAAGWRARTYGTERCIAVRETAAQLNIPCFMIDERTFEDPYSIARTIRALVSATPVGTSQRPTPVPRITLVDQILKTDLLQKPSWA